MVNTTMFSFDPIDDSARIVIVRTNTKQRITTIMTQTPNVQQAPQPASGDIALVRGTVTFSRLCSWVDGDELERANANSRYQRLKPYVTVALVEPQIVSTAQNGQLSPVEQFAQSKISVARSGRNQGRQVFYTTRSKPRNSDNLPPVFRRLADGSVEQVAMQSDLMSDQTITLILRYFTFDGARGEEGSLSLDGVIVESEKPQFRGAELAGELEALGIVVAGGIKPQQPAQAAAPAGAEAPAQEESPWAHASPAQAQPDWSTQQQPQQPQAPASQQAPVQQAQAPAQNAQQPQQHVYTANAPQAGANPQQGAFTDNPQLAAPANPWETR